MWSIHKSQRKNWKVYGTGNTDFIHKNEVDKTSFQHDMAYDKTKHLTKRTQSDNVLRDKTFKVVSDSRYDD